MKEFLELGLIGKMGLGEEQTALFLAGAFCVIVSYLLGSINFAVIFSKRFFKEDVREHGSGNAGSTNMLRTYGLKAALLTFVCDFFKSFLACCIGLVVMPYHLGFVSICGLCALIGHAFPLFYGFKGGKCVASLAGVLLVVNPLVWVLLMLVFVFTVALTKFVSLGSVICALCIPILNIMIAFPVTPPPPAEIICTALMAALVVFLHRKNIVRLWTGTESKISFKSKKS